MNLAREILFSVRASSNRFTNYNTDRSQRIRAQNTINKWRGTPRKLTADGGEGLGTADGGRKKLAARSPGDAAGASPTEAPSSTLSRPPSRARAVGHKAAEGGGRRRPGGGWRVSAGSPSLLRRGRKPEKMKEK